MNNSNLELVHYYKPVILITAGTTVRAVLLWNINPYLLRFMYSMCHVVLWALFLNVIRVIKKTKLLL